MVKEIGTEEWFADVSDDEDPVKCEAELEI